MCLRKMKIGEHPSARDTSTTTSSVSGFPKAGTSCFSATETVPLWQIPALPVPRASSAPLNKVDISGWVDDGASCPAPHLLPQCWVPVLPGFPDGAELPLLHLSHVRVPSAWSLVEEVVQGWQEEFFVMVAWWTVTMWVLLLRMYPHL